MGLGFKYHVVTIAAIFFALAIGLVVGSLYGSPRMPRTMMLALDALKKSQAQAEKNTSELAKNTTDLKQERDALQTCLRQSLPYALKGRLSGQMVALVQSGEISSMTADAHDTLTLAGARVVSVTTLERPFEQPDELLLPQLTALHATDARLPADRAGLAASLANVFQSGETGLNALMPLFQTAGIVRFDTDSHYDLPIHTVVLLTGSRSEATNLAANVDVPLISALQKAGITVYACEAQEVVTSSFPQYHASGLQVNTIEKADTDPGRWQLVSDLANAAP